LLVEGIEFIVVLKIVSDFKIIFVEFNTKGCIMNINKGNSSFGTQKRQEKVRKTPVFLY